MMICYLLSFKNPNIILLSRNKGQICYTYYNSLIACKNAHVWPGSFLYKKYLNKNLKNGCFWYLKLKFELIKEVGHAYLENKNIEEAKLCPKYE
jgi:hypothetical protein